MARLLIKNIGQLATPKGVKAQKGSAQGAIDIIDQAAIVVDNGLIAYAGSAQGAPCEADAVIDAEGRLVTPGLVDAHTHLVFGGWRQHELALKLAGVPYLEILARGGGILSTVKSTRQTSRQDLYTKAAAILHEMLLLGTTTCEIKSGYGLNIADEIKQLKVIRELKQNCVTDIVPTFLGAHALPEEYKDNREGYIKLVCEEMLPAVQQQGLAGFCDIFCESGVFSAEESRRILLTAQQHGLDVKIHADEIDCIGGSELAAELTAISAEHLIQSDEPHIQAMAGASVIGVLLPATSFYLDKPYAKARTMIQHNMAVAVASDFNPGSCPSFNLQLAMNIACLKYRLSPPEALTAVTLNAAAAINMADRIGSLEVGKQGDILIWDAPDLDYILYRFGSNLIKTVIKKGEIYS